MYIEGLGSASLANGVLRIETLVRNARGEDVAGPDLLIPIGRVESIVETLKSLIGQIQQQAQPSAAQDDAPSIERMVY